ncbi:MAG TPA: ABC transporter ATP-binding protein [Acidobacteriota bacterium]|nr:ABC transporter ATP-binding protein [Acidobacteriota bacterium]
MNPVIVLKEVKKSFGKKLVLRGVSGTIEEGKVVGLLGRNGEGKTTLFRIMLDILAADSGAISILGHSPNGSASIRQMVGYVPERPVYHDFMTVGEVFRLRAGFFPAWNWAKAREMASRLELDLDTRIHGASKGTLAKTAWICATAHNPEVLLLDEPTSGLDAVVRESLLSHFVKELSHSRKTILVTNHHMEELLGVLDEVWLMSAGRIQATYSIEQLRSHAYRVAGRLKSNTSTPRPVGLYEEQRIGDLVRWLIIDKEALYTIRQMDILDQMEVESLPLETTFKVLLSKTAEPAY